jgi:hypothetical protein
MLLLLIEWESLWLILCHTWEDRKNDRTEWRTVWMLLMTTIKCIECQTTNSNIIGRFNVWFLISGVPNAPQEQVHPVDGTLQSNNVFVVHWMCNLTYYYYSLACIKGGSTIPLPTNRSSMTHPRTKRGRATNDQRASAVLLHSLVGEMLYD